MTAVVNPHMWTPEQSAALDVARGLAIAGVPLFVAPPADNALGFALPAKWQHTAADPSVVDDWRPGWALCAVMGVAMDCLDVDPRNGGDRSLTRELMDDVNPSVLGGQTTPSGGFHFFVAPLGVGSRDGVLPGVDVKGGMPDGLGRGFAFLAPTVKPSKVTGEPAEYSWVRAPGDRESWPARRSEKLAAAVLAAKSRSHTSSKSGKADMAGVSPELAGWATQRAPMTPARADRDIAAKLKAVREHGATTGTGFRETLMRAAFTLGGYVGAKHLSADDASDALSRAVADNWGSADADDMRWIEQGLRDGEESPMAVAEPVYAAPPPPVEPFDPAYPFGREPFAFPGGADDQEIADAALARAVRAARVLWANVSTGMPPWIMRESDHWGYIADGSKVIVQSLRDTMPVGVRPESKDTAEWTEENWAHHARARMLKAMAALAGLMDARVRRRGHWAVVRAEQVDANPAVIWAGGRSWAIAGLTPDVEPEGTPHFHTSPCEPAPGPTPAWDAFTAALWPDAEVREWALRVLAVGFTGHSDAVMPVLWGPPGKGKSKLMGRLLDVLGGYGRKASTALIQPHIGNADVAKAELQGVRLAWLDEGLGTGKASVEAVKDITGGGEVYAAAKYRAPVLFRPTHTLVLTTNNEPEIHDDGLARRARIIPCHGEDAEIGTTFDALLLVWAGEAPAVLAQMLALAADYLRDWRTVAHSAAPQAIKDQTAALAESQDVVGQWLAERTRPDDGGSRSNDLYMDFVSYAKQFPQWARHQPASNVWGKRLDREGYGVHKKPRNVKHRPLALSSGDYSPLGPITPSGGWGTGVTGGGYGSPEGGSHPSSCENPPNVTGVTPQTPLSWEGNTETVKKKEEGNNGGAPVTRNTRNPSEPAPTTPAQAQTTAFSTRCPGCNAEPGVTTQGKIRAHKADKIKCEGSGAKVPGWVTPAESQRRARAAELAGATLELPAAMHRGGEPRSVPLGRAAEILAECLERNAGTLGVDIETNGLPQWHPRFEVRTIQLGDWSEAVDLDAADPAHRDVARQFLERAAELNAQSYTADLAPLAKLGVIEDYAAACDKTVDTATRAKLADPRLTGGGDGLKELAATVLGDKAESPAAEAAKDAWGRAAGVIWKLKPDTPDDKNGWLCVDKRSAVMVRYALSDVLDCCALRRMLPEPAPEVDVRERVAQRIMARLPLEGIALDAAAVGAQLAEREPRAAEKLARIRALGVANPDSPKQVTSRLAELGAALPQTKEGNPSAAGEVLGKLETAPGELGELATLLRQYRDDATVLKNMIRPWARSTQGGDSRTYPTIYTLGADTGRMSCVRPNLQQVARSGGMRECLLAGEGYKIVAADFSSVEVRVAAALSQDPTLMRFVREGRDLHGEIAKLVFGEGWTKSQRYGVKGIVFGRLYGGGLDTLARQAGLDHATTQRCLDVLDAMTPGLKAWSEGLKAAVKSGLREFRTYSGRVIHLDPELPHKAPNWAIQGTARELLIDGLVRWDEGPYAGGVILPVHDEVVAFVPEESADDAVRVLETAMTTELFGVPIAVEADAPADRWQSAA